MTRSRFTPLLSLSILVALILSSCAPLLTPTPKSTPTRFEKTDCVFGNTTGVDCGYLYVPEDRSQPDGAQIKLAVAIIRSSNPNPAPDPVLLLFSWLNGPGTYTLYSIQGFMFGFKGILANRDVILFDKRGTGYSSPTLDCPELKSQAMEDAPQNLKTEELQQHRFEAYQACHDRLEQEGIDLSAYTNAADAADINDLRVALGYKEWNIYGDTYGARLALRIMRDFPEGVRSVILDSAYPPQANWDAEAVVNAERALKLFFERCASDEACNTAYPNLETVFYDTAAQLDANPIPLDVVSHETQETVRVLINGDRLINLIVHLLSFTDALPYIPGWIYKFHDGSANSDDMLKAVMYFFVFAHEFSSEGKGLSVQCGEEISVHSTQDSETTNAEVAPSLQEILNQGRYLALCPAWGVEPTVATEIQPVVSDIPTLLLTGDNDPGSPPAWAVSTSENLSHAYYFEFPWASQGLMYSGSPVAECARGMVSAFIVDPTSAPDATCMKGLKAFFVTQ